MNLKHLKKLKVLTCRKCNFEAENERHLQIHISSCHDEEFVNCSVCSFETSDTEIMKDHTVNHSTQGLAITAQVTNPVQMNKCADKTQTIPCPFCNFASKSNQELKVHITNIHLDEKMKENNVQDGIHI